MIAGRLKEKITIQSPTIIINEYGEETIEYTDTYTTRARITDGSNMRNVINSEIFHTENRFFYVRLYVPIKEDDIIKWEGRLYRVISISTNKDYAEKTITGGLIND